MSLIEVYQNSFTQGAGGWRGLLAAPNSYFYQQAPVQSADGESYAAFSGTGAIDKNHITGNGSGDGFGALALAFVNTPTGMGLPALDWRGGAVNFKGEFVGFVIPEQADGVFFWVQSWDDRQGKYVNMRLDQPIDAGVTRTDLGNGFWQLDGAFDVTLALSIDETDWTMMGSRPEKTHIYGTSNDADYILQNNVLGMGLNIQGPDALANGVADFRGWWDTAGELRIDDVFAWVDDALNPAIGSPPSPPSPPPPPAAPSGERPPLPLSDEGVGMRPDGSWVVTDSDWYDEFPWAWVQDEFDPQGHRIAQNIFSDDWGRVSIYFDPINQNPWQQVTDYYDHSGNRTSQVIQHDGGAHTLVYWDPHDQFIWASYVEKRDALNRTTERTYTNDAEHLVHAERFTFDYLNAEDWTRTVDSINPLGITYQTAVHWDVGGVDLFIV